MYEFDYRRAESLDQARQWLIENEDGKLLAGGMTLLPTLKLRLAQPSLLIDLAGIRDLRGIHWDDETLTIGALNHHAEVAGSIIVQRAIPALARLAGHIGDPQVRNRGTLGGSIANADPAADYPAAVLGLNATILTDRREIMADAFFMDLFETALDEREIVIAVRFTLPRRAAYIKFPNPASRYAIVGVFVAEHETGVRVAVTGAGPCAFRLPAMERALGADFRPETLDGIEVDAEGFNTDIHASAEYRAHLVGVMAHRAVTACLI
jgi:aerobic carbon-monoxide dehydrogenase medium subunit